MQVDKQVVDQQRTDRNIYPANERQLKGPDQVNAYRATRFSVIYLLKCEATRPQIHRQLGLLKSSAGSWPVSEHTELGN